MHILVTLSSSHSEATSFQRYKWPITKMYTTSTVFLAYNVSCHFTRCIPFCSKPNKPLFAWWKFYDSQSEAPIQMVFKATLKWITPLKRVSCEANCMLKNGVRNCLHVCVRSLFALERCGSTYFTSTTQGILTKNNEQRGRTGITRA